MSKELKTIMEFPGYTADNMSKFKEKYAASGRRAQQHALRLDADERLVSSGGLRACSEDRLQLLQASGFRKSSSECFARQPEVRSP